MLNAIALELSTGGQPCLATADNDRFEFFHRPSLARHRGRIVPPQKDPEVLLPRPDIRVTRSPVIGSMGASGAER